MSDSAGHGLSPRRKLLLVGPPGTGKTLTASVLASELRLPLVVPIRQPDHEVHGRKRLQATAVFDALKTSRGVYLFDEFDFQMLQRGSQHDVAEMRRTLNMFLQLIEQDTSDSLIVAATNHGASTGSALFRRFDDVIRYEAPDDAQVELLLRNCLTLLAPAAMDYRNLAAHGRGLTHSDVVKACQDAMKDAVLEQHKTVGEASVIQHLEERAASQRWRECAVESDRVDDRNHCSA